MLQEEMMRKQENLSSPKHIANESNQLNVGVRLYQKGLKK